MRRVAAALLACAPALALAGEVSGRVTFAGEPPPTKPVTVPRGHEACGRELPDESLLVHDGALENVVVWLDAPGKPAGGTALLDQRGCRFSPRVLAASVGTDLAVNNGEAVMHHVVAQLGEDVLLRWPLPIRDRPRRRTLDRPGVIEVRCESGHPWQKAFVHVFAHPFFAVTGREGRFALQDVPDGEWKLHAWHETLGAQEATVTVKGGATHDLVFHRTK